MWIGSTLHLLQNPDSGEIEGIYCAKDVTKQKKDEAIMTRISQSGYDFIGIIDPFRRTFELHNGFWECNGMECGVRVDYDSCVERLTGGYVAPGEREALAQALNEGRLAGAGIDVFEGEPPIAPEHPLCHAKNTVLTPHVAFASAEALAARADIVFANIEKWLAGTPQNVIK